VSLSHRDATEVPVMTAGYALPARMATPDANVRNGSKAAIPLMSAMGGKRTLDRKTSNYPNPPKSNVLKSPRFTAVTMLVKAGSCNCAYRTTARSTASGRSLFPP